VAALCAHNLAINAVLASVFRGEVLTYVMTSADAACAAFFCTMLPDKRKSHQHDGDRNQTVSKGGKVFELLNRTGKTVSSLSADNESSDT
jgi:hypothetical protein